VDLDTVRSGSGGVAMTVYRIVKSTLRKDSSTDLLVVDCNDEWIGYLDAVIDFPADPGPLQMETVCNTGMAVFVSSSLAALAGIWLGVLIRPLL